MKRFWKNAAAVKRDGLWSVDLDGRPFQTPARKMFAVPASRLAQAVAEEWNAVEGEINPRHMPLTGLGNAAIDQIAPDKERFAAGLARYAEGDLACYRAEGPPELVRRQSESWDALLGWARRRFDVDFKTTLGLLHVEQPASTVERLSHAVAALDAFHLAGLSPLVTIGGSLIAALGVLEGAFPPEQGWHAVSIDERWQLEQWGSEAEAEAALENRYTGFMAGARFLELLES